MCIVIPSLKIQIMIKNHFYNIDQLNLVHITTTCFFIIQLFSPLKFPNTIFTCLLPLSCVLQVSPILSFLI